MSSKMKGLLILAVVLIMSFVVPVSATNYHAADEFHRSMARYRQFLEHEDTAAIMRTLLKVDEKVKESLGSASDENEKATGNPQVEDKIDHLNLPVANHATVLDPEMELDEFQDLGQDAVERQVPADINATDSVTDENSTREQLEGEDGDLKANKKEAVVQEEAIVEKPTEEILNEGVDRDQQQQRESLEKDVKLEQESGEQAHEGLTEGEEKESQTENKDRFIVSEPYFLGPKIEDWDEQRAEWLEKNPRHQRPVDKPKVLIITGSQPYPCHSSVGDYFHIQSLKLKMDYARMHNYEIFYTLALLDPLFNNFWAKLPIVRKLMLTHPEIEWFFWVDSDAVFTDMLFEAPFHTYEGYNMVMWGWNDGVYGSRLWTAFNAGVFIIRNCQWTLDLIDKWSPLGPDGPVREAFGHFLTNFLAGRKDFDSYPADDQSALAYLLLTDEAVKAKVKLVERTEYFVSGWWVDTVPLYSESMEKFHPGLGDYRWPFITHFTGCSPCNGEQGSNFYEKCMAGFESAYNFADNQVLAFMGFQHESLSSPNLTRTRYETGRALEFVDVNPWEERIAQVAGAAIS